MKKRALRFELLDDRRLLAVTAGLDAAALLSPTEAAPFGYRVGDVCIASAIDIDGDGFIGPSELSYMSYAWFTADGHENWNPAADFDGDGFVGPGDYAILSSHWFRTCEELPDDLKSIEIYPSDLQNWLLAGNQISKISAKGGTLTLDARGGELEAICDYGGFSENIRVTADFKAAAAPFQGGLELALGESGECYYAELRSDRVYLYYVGGNGEMNLLDGTAYAFAADRTYTVWGQVSGGTVSFGVGGNTLLSVGGARLSGGWVGFRAAGGVAEFSGIAVKNDPDAAPAVSNRVGDVIVDAQIVENGAVLPDPLISYEIVPSDTQNWLLAGDKISKATARGGTLTLDARSGALEAVCDYGGFPAELLVTSYFRSSDPTVTFAAGMELAVRDSGECYYAEFSPGGVTLYYVDEAKAMTALGSAPCTLDYNRDYAVWAQLSGGRLACGVGQEVLLSVGEARLSGGNVGFYASAGLNAFQTIGVYTGESLYDIGPTPEEENAAIRAEIVAYMRSMATIEWIPAEDITFYDTSLGVMFKAGQTYYGVPYSQKVRNGSYELFSSYLDENHVYRGPTGSSAYIGSDCSSAITMAWRTFDPQQPFLGPYYRVPGRGNIVKVGEYEYTSDTVSSEITSYNGREVMYAAYALLKPGDTVLWYRGSDGHIRMVSAVDPANQCVYVIEQAGATQYETPIAGNSTWRVDRKITFASLYSNGYIPLSHKGLQLG